MWRQCGTIFSITLLLLPLLLLPTWGRDSLRRAGRGATGAGIRTPVMIVIGLQQLGRPLGSGGSSSSNSLVASSIYHKGDASRQHSCAVPAVMPSPVAWTSSPDALLPWGSCDSAQHRPPARGSNGAAAQHHADHLRNAASIRSHPTHQGAASILRPVVLEVGRRAREHEQRK